MAVKRPAGKKAMFLKAMSKEGKRPKSPAKGAKPLPFGKQPAGAANVKAPHARKGPKPPAGRHAHKALARHSIKKQAAMTPDPGKLLGMITKPTAAPKKKKGGKSNFAPV